MASYVLCNTVETLDAALQTLSAVDTIFLDCEGVHLGSVGGSLSIIGVGALEQLNRGVERVSIFLIDIRALEDRNNWHMKRLFSLLELETPLKVVFD
jgi:exonuclease 3'-5' domain-containing protein 1